MQYLAILSILSFGTSCVLTYGLLRLSNAKRIGIDERNDVPRIGGLAIMLTATLMSLLFKYDDRMLLALAPAALIALLGLLDDLGFALTPALKLIVSLVAASAAIMASGVYVAHINTPFLTSLFDFTPFAVVVSIIALAGMCHGVNLIDGLNGLALCFAISACFALAAIALQVEALNIATLSMIIAAASLGLLFFNFPHGLIFMGDVGSYFIGFMSAWIAIYICYKFPNVTPWAMICIFAYPITDVGYAAIRRLLTFQNPMRGDRDHLHHRLQQIFFLRTGNRDQSVKLTTLICTCMTILPASISAVYYENPFTLMGLAGTSIIILTCCNLFAASLSKR